MQLRGTDIVVDKIRAKRNIISGSGATASLSESDSGSMVLFDRAAGIVFTLPAACAVGTWYEFAVTVTVTSNAAKVITGAGTELLVGNILNCDTDTSDAVAIWNALVGDSYIAVSMNGSTTGGIKGDRFRVTKLNSTTWVVEGMTSGTGTVATPFSAS